MHGTICVLLSHILQRKNLQYILRAHFILSNTCTYIIIFHFSDIKVKIKIVPKYVREEKNKIKYLYESCKINNNFEMFYEVSKFLKLHAY